MADLFAAYQHLDAALVAAGFVPTSPWWLEQLGLVFNRHQRRALRRWIIRAGRRAGKSSTLCRLAVLVALFGSWSVPPGDTAVIAIVSVKTEEASARLRTIKAILDAMGEDYAERGNEIELLGDRAVVFRVYPCNVDSVGFTSVLVIGDEVARWESRDTGANPAKEVVGSLAPTMATQSQAFLVLSSAPWSTDDFHAECFDQGDTATQMVSYAPTWTANPTITEAETHELEPDPVIWRREYLAEPGATTSLALDAVDLEACHKRAPQSARVFNFLTVDASSLRGDAFAWLEGHQTTTAEIVVETCSAFEGEELRNVTMRDVVARIAGRAHELGVGVIYGDQREDASLVSMFSEYGITFDPIPWTDVSKDDAFQALRRLMRERKLLLPEHDKLLKQCRNVKARLMPSGRTKYETNGKDYLSALVTLAHRVVSGHIGELPDPNARANAWSADINSEQWLASEVRTW